MHVHVISIKTYRIQTKITRYLFLYSLQILKPSEKKAKYQYCGLNSGRPITTKAASNKT